jgi:glutamate-1-semialdehyde aminotransferase
LACIGELRRPGVYAALAATGSHLMTTLQRLCDDARVPVRVLGEPAVFQPWFTSREVVDHRSTLDADRARAAAFTDRLLDAGVVKAHEKFFLSTVHGPEEIGRTVEAFADAVERLASGPSA